MCDLGFLKKSGQKLHISVWVRGCGQIFARIASATARAQRWLCLDTS